MTNDDIRQIIEDVIAPLKADLGSVKVSVDKIERTTISRVEYDPAILALQNDIKRLRRTNAVLRKRLDNLWKNIVIAIATVGGAILVILQIADRVIIR